VAEIIGSNMKPNWFSTFVRRRKLRIIGQNYITTKNSNGILSKKDISGRDSVCLAEADNAFDPTIN